MSLLLGKALFSLPHQKRIVLNPGWGGLGDALQYSTLPEQFWKQKGQNTYLYEGYKTRNSEIYDLVWARNPYVLGQSSGRPNAGDTAPYSNCTENFIKNIELSPD